MREGFTYKSFHEQLVADVFPERLSDADAMLLFALLHTHQIELVGAVVLDAPDTLVFSAITQRCCSECLAHLWRGTKDSRGQYTHWYWKWNTEWSCDRIDALSGSELQRFREIRLAIEAHPAIASVVPEDP